MDYRTLADCVSAELTDADREAAVALAHFLDERGLTAVRDMGYWRDKLYYIIKLDGADVLFISINDPDEKWNRLTVWSDDMDSKSLMSTAVSEDIKLSAWAHVDRCGHCGSCAGGRKKVIFGREFNDVCGCTFRIDNPDMTDLLFIKTIIDIRISEVANQQID